MKSWLYLLIALSLAACDNFKDRAMPDLSDVKANLAFTCAYEKDHIPPRDPEADQLYVHARWLRKNNLLKEDPLVYPKIERLIRIATAYGHDKANLELRNMIGQGKAGSVTPGKEPLDLVEDLIRRGIPGGYYDMGVYLERGAGVKQDKELALKYYRKAADLGSPEGQFVVAEKLDPPSMAPDIAKQMFKCAAEQGHGKAALSLAIGLKSLENNYPEAIKAFQLGVKAGNETAASFLEGGFNGPPSTDGLEYLGQQKDPERVRRYEAIGEVLGKYSYLHPKVPEIDEIVPLPPAKLPPWNGKLKWLEEHKANVPPPLPSEERIREMAKAKHLDPDTGRPIQQKRADAAPEPLPDSVPQQAAAPKLPLGTVASSLQHCPQTGLWECTASLAAGEKRRFFPQGMALPQVIVRGPERSLLQKLKGDPPNVLAETTWTLVSYEGPGPEKDKA